MQRLLIISKYFAPTSITGTRRINNIVKYLFYNGYEIKVISHPPSWKFPTDYKEVNKIIIKKVVIRFNIKSIFFFDNLVWSFITLTSAIILIKNKKPNYILTTGGPFLGNFLITYILGKLFHIKYILDYRDPWNQPCSNIAKFPGKYTKYIYYNLEKVIIKNAHHVICATKQLSYCLIEMFPFQINNITHIYNGFKTEEMKPQNNEIKINSNTIHVVFTGQINSSTALDEFLTILDRMKKYAPEVYCKIKISFAGLIDDKYQLKVKKNEHDIQYFGILNKSEADKLQLQADVLLVMDNSDGVPLKIFDYLNKGIPIFILINGKNEIFPLLTGVPGIIIEDYLNQDSSYNAFTKLIMSILLGQNTVPELYRLEQLSLDYNFSKLKSILI